MAKVKEVNGKTFEEWMARVDAECINISGVSIYDLPDYAFFQAWRDEETPEDVAARVLEYEGFPF